MPICNGVALVVRFICIYITYSYDLGYERTDLVSVLDIAYSVTGFCVCVFGKTNRRLCHCDTVIIYDLFGSLSVFACHSKL